MTAKVIEAALGIAAPWSVASVDFDDAAKVLAVQINFRAGKDRANLKPAAATALDDMIVKLPHREALQGADARDPETHADQCRMSIGEFASCAPRSNR